MRDVKEEKDIEEEEIIGYRIGQGLFCVDCYEKSAKKLKAVQNPEDPEVKFPSRAITAEDVSIFICEHCKSIKGPSAAEVKVEERKDLGDLALVLEQCGDRLALLEGVIVQYTLPYDSIFSEKGKTGFYQTLVDVQEKLDFVGGQLLSRKED